MNSLLFILVAINGDGTAYYYAPTTMSYVVVTNGHVRSF